MWILVEFQFGPCQTRWLEALESDIYPQTYNYLMTAGGFCCLGVADVVCDLKEPYTQTLHETFNEVGLQDEDGTATLTDELRAFMKMKRPGIHADHGEVSKISLTRLNDRYAFTFAEIAETLRKFPELFFTRPV